MDRKLRVAKRNSRRRQERNGRAWQRFSPDGRRCRFCPHDYSTHASNSGQPHFYRMATPEEERDVPGKLYRYRYFAKGAVRRPLLRRITVARNAEIIATFCTACAKELGTAQVLCYQRTHAIGEVVLT